MTLKINFSRPASALFEKNEKRGEKGVLGEASVTGYYWVTRRSEYDPVGLILATIGVLGSESMTLWA